MDKPMKTAKEIQENLIQFCGTEQYYRHPLGILLTSGTKYLFDSAEAWWIADIVASYQFHAKVKLEEFQVYKLKVNEDKSAILNIEDGNYNIITSQNIEWTTFPLDEIEIWFANGVCYLPSEH